VRNPAIYEQFLKEVTEMDSKMVYRRFSSVMKGLKPLEWKKVRGFYKGN